MKLMFEFWFLVFGAEIPGGYLDSVSGSSGVLDVGG